MLSSEFICQTWSLYLPVNEVSGVLRDWSGMMRVSTKGAGVFLADTRQCPFEVICPKNEARKRGNMVSSLLVTANGIHGREMYILQSETRQGAGGGA